MEQCPYLIPVLVYVEERKQSCYFDYQYRCFPQLLSFKIYEGLDLHL